MFYKNVHDDLIKIKTLLTGDIRPATFYKRWCIPTREVSTNQLPLTRLFHWHFPDSY